MVKLGKAKDHKGVIVNVTKTCDRIQVYPIEVIIDDGQQTINNIDVSTIIPVVNTITNLGMISYYFKIYIYIYIVLICLVYFLVCCFYFRLMYVLFVWTVFNKKNVPRGNFLGEAKKQVQGLLPIDSRLITNILNNPIHSNENVPNPSNHVLKKEK
jgi:hypothetical protein